MSDATFRHTRPAGLDAAGGPDAWAEFRVGRAQERLSLLRELRDGTVPVVLNGPDGSALATTVWSLDARQERLSFSTGAQAPQLERLVEADEAVAVAYLASVKLQFDVHGFVVVRGATTSALQCRLPAEIYRFQRRSAYRVRTDGRHAPRARLRHPSLPEMTLTLRVLDLSLGGCALWLPHDVPPLQAGTRLAEVQVELDGDTRFAAALALQHVSSLAGSEPGAGGVRIGCAWQPLASPAERQLQRWIDRSQQRRRLLALG